MHKLGVKDIFEKINRKQNNFKFQIWNIPQGKTALLFTRTTQKAVFHLLFQPITFPANDTKTVTYSLTCSKSGFIEMLDIKFKTVFFFFPIQESIIFSRLKSYQKQIQRNLNKSRNQAFPITHSKCTCTVTKWPPGKKIYIYKCSLSACCSSKNCYVFVHILFSIFLVIIGTIGRKKVKAPPCLQIDQNKIGHTTHCRITCIIPLPPPR